MLNQVVCMGRLYNKPSDYCCIEGDYKIFEIKVPRPEPSTREDIIRCLTTETIAKNLAEYVRVDDIIAIRGSLRWVNDRVHVLVDKLTYLACKGGE